MLIWLLRIIYQWFNISLQDKSDDEIADVIPEP